MSLGAVRHLNYAGDIAASAVPQVVGPNTLREFLVSVDAVYDPAADQTRVGFRYATVDEIAGAADQIAGGMNR